MVKSIWQYRGFIFSSVKRSYQMRYQNSLLGATWTVTEPLALIIIYTIVFSKIMQHRLPGVEDSFAYSIYLCSGIVTWRLFSEIISKGQMVFIENANLLKKLMFPRICLPIIVILNALVNFIIFFLLFTIFLLVTDNFPGAIIVAMIPLLSIQVIFTIGLGIILGVLNTFFRDVGQFMQVALQFWFWLTPIIYPISILPEKVQSLLIINPMTILVVNYRKVIVYKEMPDWLNLIPITVISVALCVYGIWFFRKHSGEIVDQL